MSNVNPSFGDKEILKDMLSSQKETASGYNTAAGECAAAGLQNELLTILGEEHKIQYELFTEMSKRGWYPTQPAEQQKITEAKEQFKNTNS